MANRLNTKMSKYSNKTAITLYRFDSEDEYWSWLNANQRSAEYNDVMALVKNEDMNNGYDLFVNGHSLTKSRLWIKKLNGDIIDATTPGAFGPDCQYLLKNFTRKGQGQKNIIVLEEVNIEQRVNDITNNFINTTFRTWLDNYMLDYLEDFMDGYMVRKFYPLMDDYMRKFLDNYLQEHIDEHKQIYNILTDTHHNFRKIFSLLHKRKSAQLSLDINYIDRNGNIRKDFGIFIKNASIAKFQFRISGAEGLDITYKSLKIYKNNETEPIFVVEGENIINGINGTKEFHHFIESDSTLTAVLEYTNRYLDNDFIDDIEKFDIEPEYKTEHLSVSKLTKFYIVNEPELQDKPTAFVFYVPMEKDEAGTLRLKYPYNTIKDFETVNWLMKNALPKIDGDISVFLTSDGERLEYFDNGKVLTNDSNYGEYSYPKSDIYAQGFSITDSSTTKVLNIPGNSETYYKVYTIVPSENSVKFNSIGGEMINEEIYDEKSLKVYKNTSENHGESSLKIEIL